AAFFAWRRMRWAFFVLSALFLVNVYFPYVYYLRYVHRRATDLGGAFDVFYGRDIAGVRLKLLSLATAVVCVAVAAGGWRWLTATDGGARSLLSFRAPDADVAATLPPEPKEPWTLRLHPV